MKYVFIKMFSTFSTIVPNIQYNCSQRLVQLSSTFSTIVLNIEDIFCIGLLTAYITYSYCLCIGLGIILSVELFFYVSTYHIFQTTVAS